MQHEDSGRNRKLIYPELISRSAHVTLKEKRTLVVVPRETPFNTIHLQNMTGLAVAGAVVLPPIPAFYTKPRSVDEIVDYVVGKVLDIFDIPHDLFRRWSNEEARASLRETK